MQTKKARGEYMHDEIWSEQNIGLKHENGGNQQTPLDVTKANAK